LATIATKSAIEGLLVGINNPQPAADIEAVDPVAVGAQLADQLAHPDDGARRGSSEVSCEPMCMATANHPEVEQPAGQREGLARQIDVDAELVLLAPRGDLGVGAGIDVGIDPDGDVAFAPSWAARHSRSRARPSSRR
jgi:hypothetical protein